MNKKIKVELGCGNNLRTIEEWENIGIDIIKSDCVNYVVNLGFEKIPLNDNSVDRVQSYDLFEHIPKCVWVYDMENYKYDIDDRKQYRLIRLTPFIFLMNEIYRIMKDKSLLIVETPFSDQAFRRDPTHVNHLSSDWYEYFIKTHDKLYHKQGLIKTNFKLLKQEFRKYMWTDKDIMHTELIAEKSEPLI